MLRNKEAATRLVAYYLKHPLASAHEASKETGTTRYQAQVVRAQRATPIEVYIAEQAAAEGRKDDTGKLPWHLLPSDATEEILKVLAFGASKYGPRNWERGMAWSRPFAALMRHMWAWWRGERADPETGLSHLAHAGCCILFLLAYEQRSVGIDDRAKEE
jgi:hypothetical protein